MGISGAGGSDSESRDWELTGPDLGSEQFGYSSSPEPGAAPQVPYTCPAIFRGSPENP